MESTSLRLEGLPPELLAITFSYLNIESLSSLRLVNHRISDPATQLLFRSITLLGCEWSTSYAAFINIAKSQRLCQLVEEVVCEAWNMSDYNEEDWDERYNHQPINGYFWAALPFIRSFRKLKSLYIRFAPRVHDDFTRTEGTDFPYWSSIDCRFRILTAIFQNITGEEGDLRSSDSIGGSPVQLRKLTVLNISDFYDHRLTHSPSFKAVLNMDTLTDIRLGISHIVLDEDEDSHDHGLCLMKACKDTEYMMQSLPITWLSPSVAQNLRALDFEYDEGLGWFQNFDFATITPAMPNLKALTMRKFHFYRPSQLDWIKSIGRNNRCGGLEELHLHNCMVLCLAHVCLYYDSKPFVRKGLGDYGNDVYTWTADKDYPIIDYISYLDQPINRDWILFEVRWHMLLDRVRESITSLETVEITADMENELHPLEPISVEYPLTYSSCLFWEYEAVAASGDEAEYIFPWPLWLWNDATRAQDEEAWSRLKSELAVRRAVRHNPR